MSLSRPEGGVDITETQILQGGVSQAGSSPGAVGVELVRADIEHRCLLGFFLDIFDSILNLFGQDDIEDALLRAVQNAIREIDFTEKIGVVDFPLTLKQIRMNEQEVREASLRLTADVDKVDVTPGGLMLTLKATFFSTSTDPRSRTPPARC